MQGHEDELAALELKSTGRYADALTKAAAALRAVLDGPEIDPEREARTEFLVALADNLAEKIPDHSAFTRLVDELRERPAVTGQPVLLGWMQHLAALHALHQGDAQRATQLLDGLGYVRDFLVLGPLDNERGSGFRRQFPPELAPATPIDFAATLPGKKRDVAWRRVQLFDVPLAALDLDARLRPNTQSLAYAAFSVLTESELDACVRAGTTGSLAVFVNGHEVLRRDCERRPLGFDQDVGSFRLARGRNLVLVKLCTQQGDWAGRLRLTDPDGRPLRGARTSAEPTHLAEAMRTQAPAARAAPPRLGGVAWLERQMPRVASEAPAAAGDEGRRLGLHAFRLAMLLALRAEDDDAQRRDRKYARLACDLLPDSGMTHFLLGFTELPRSARADADRDENARLRAYLASVNAWPRCAEAMRALADLERSARGNLAKAETWIEQALAINPRYGYAWAEKLACLAARGFEAGFAKSVLDALADPELGAHPAVMRMAAQLYEQRNDVTRLLALQERLLALDFDLGNLAGVARTRLRAGQVREALAAAERAAAVFPDRRDAWDLLAGVRLAAEDAKGAADAWNEWLAVCPEDERAWIELAELAALNGKRDLEVSCLERAVALEPGLKEESRRLEYLRAGSKTFYSGYEIDAKAALAADPGPDADAAEKSDAHYYVFRHTLVRAYRDGTTSRYEHFLVRVLNQAGVREFDHYQPPFYGEDQTARVLEAKVIHDDGSEERARLGQAWSVDLPPIKPGDCVEVAARVDDRARSFFGDYFGYAHAFAAWDTVPVRMARLDLLLEAGRTYHFQKVGDVPEPQVAKLADGAEHRRYEMSGLPRRDTEERAPSLLESGPLLRVTTYASWDEFAAWWWNLIRKQTVVTPEIKAKVAELTKDAATLEDKVRRLYEFVVTEVRYKAWEFGVHGYKPYSVGAIFARRHGDCKDKAILLNAMLSEIGVQAWPVLIHADDSRERDDLTLPMVEHFNHCISFVPAQQGLPARFLDGTAEYHPIDTLPSMDRGAHVLTVLGEKAQLQPVPWTTPEENRDDHAFRVKLMPSGDAEVEVLHRPRLNFAPPVRARFGNEPGKRRDLLSDAMGRLFGESEVVEIQFSNLLDLSRDVEYLVKLKVRGLAARDAGESGGLRVKVAFRRDELVRLAAAEQRTQDLLLTTPESEDETIDYVAPEGYEWGSLPPDVALDNAIGSFRLQLVRDGDKVTIRRSRALKVQRVARADFALFKQLVETADRADRLELRLRRVR
jgi:tetratricopeptide (TPR) repeat protein/transglutaminase-like putative cysteine protease